MSTASVQRCGWAKSELAIHYHDTEWGVPSHDDRVHFEFFILEAAQAGLSWNVILKKREHYRKAFCQFDPLAVSRFSEKDVEKLMRNEGLVRNRLKFRSAIENARRFLEVQEEFGSFDRYIWQFVEGKVIQNAWKELSQVPSTSPQSDAMSKDLKRRGFKFVGSTICYAHMQSTGMVNDHLVSCFRYPALAHLE
jgi:DNA-3-methyladenine glycosylase I